MSNKGEQQHTTVQSTGNSRLSGVPAGPHVAINHFVHPIALGHYCCWCCCWYSDLCQRRQLLLTAVALAITGCAAGLAGAAAAAAAAANAAAVFAAATAAAAAADIPTYAGAGRSQCSQLLLNSNTQWHVIRALSRGLLL
jgi:hypothetical protein